MLACYCVGLYLTNKEMLDVSGFPEWKGMYIIGGIILIELILRFIPMAFHPAGREKYLKKTFLPTLQFRREHKLNAEDIKKIRELDRGAVFGLLFYFGVTAVFIVLYFLKIFGAPEMFLVTMGYYVADLVCVNFFCPFRVFFMHNRCCTQCRLHNWDSLMAVFPLIIIPGVISWTLCLFGIAYAFLWEVSFRIYPERFLERTNEAIQCKNCPATLCPRKRRAFFKSVFSRE